MEPYKYTTALVTREIEEAIPLVQAAIDEALAEGRIDSIGAFAKGGTGDLDRLLNMIDRKFDPRNNALRDRICALRNAMHQMWGSPDSERLRAAHLCACQARGIVYDHTGTGAWQEDGSWLSNE